MDNIRPAENKDHAAIVTIWHAGWHEAHADLVPQDILKYREIEHFWLWLTRAKGQFFVATSHNSIIGFVTINSAEIEKLFVALNTRGTGTSDALLSFAEHHIAQSGIADAQLYCTAGNTRAERFYQRNGWVLRDTFSDALWLPTQTAAIPAVDTRHFTKHLG